MPSLVEIIHAFRGRRVLVVGDVMLDEYLYGRVDRVSPEAPVPIVSLQKRDARPGGAANVALNLFKMGAQVQLLGLRGDDEAGHSLVAACQRSGLSVDGLLTSNHRRTTRKARVLSGGQQLLRVDTEDTVSALAEESERLLAYARAAIAEGGTDLLLFEDYDKGMLTAESIGELTGLAKAAGIPTVVDPKARNFWAYRGVTLFKPNLRELLDSTEPASAGATPRERYAGNLAAVRRGLEHELSLVTMGAEGALLEDAHTVVHHQRALRRSVVDVCGAGDSVAAAVSLGLLGKASSEQLLQLANLSGALACGHVGVRPVTAAELLELASVSELAAS